MEESMHFRAKMQDGALHLRILVHDCKSYCLCIWPIRHFSTFIAGSTRRKAPLADYYELGVKVEQEQLTINIFCPSFSVYKITISTDSGTIITNSRRSPVIIQGEGFQRLKEVPNDTVIITCQIRSILRRADASKKCISVTNFINILGYLNSLQTDLKQHSSSLLKENIQLHVGDETEIVNKAVLCARSPVFARMFADDMQENKENAVTITDIKMPVVRALVFFLNSGDVRNCDLNFLCDLYYSASKYQIKELHLACIGLILSNISRNNIMRVLKLSLLHNDELLKSAIMTLISAKIDTYVSTPDWQNLMLGEPEVALKVATFFVF